MKLKIVSIHNHGDQSKEYVLLEASQDCDVGKYLLADSTFLNDRLVSNKLRHIFWFPDKDVESGDLVSVWTGKGKNMERRNGSGTKVHRFYWGLDTPVWNDDGDCAVLVEARTWQFERTRE